MEDGMKIPNVHAVGHGVFAKNLDQQSFAGCSKRELRRHIESQFKPGMSWENFGEWEIDHITPVAFFDLNTADGFLACVHFSNFQPLWRAENLRKRNKVAGFLVRPRTKRAIPSTKMPVLSFDPHKVLCELRMSGRAVVLNTVREATSMENHIRRHGLLPIRQKREDGKFRVGIKSVVLK